MFSGIEISDTSPTGHFWLSFSVASPRRLSVVARFPTREKLRPQRASFRGSRRALSGARRRRPLRHDAAFVPSSTKDHALAHLRSVTTR